MTIHVLVEGSSEFALLKCWAPRLLRAHPVRIHPHQGKGSLPKNLRARPDPRRRGLLDQLPAKLRGFDGSLDCDTDRVVILLDADDDDPVVLARAILEAAQTVSPSLHVIVRLAVEETEAFYLGDQKGLYKAFPHADRKRARQYKPDAICGTWELFGRVVGDPGGNKVDWAERMGPVLTTDPKQSRSPSFRSLISGLLEAIPGRRAPSSRRPYRHPQRKKVDVGRRR